MAYDNKVTAETALNGECDHELTTYIASNGDGTYTAIQGNKTWKNLTFDEAVALMNGKELEDGSER